MTRGEAVNWLINISADIGKVEHRELWHYEQALLEIREMLESEQKKGKWISLDDFRGKYNDYGYKCSECGEHSEYEENYCHNCGARMEGRDD